MLVIEAPNSIQHGRVSNTSIFLAGSIEMGTAEKWQEKVISELSSYDVTIFNPRRDNWDPSWKQDFNNPQFFQQVSWELDALAIADIIVFYFDPSTKSPISLLELGMFVNRCNKTIFVCCPEGYWKKGNVDIVCCRAAVPVMKSLDALISLLKCTLAT